jgi:hypothetical protein
MLSHINKRINFPFLIDLLCWEVCRRRLVIEFKPPSPLSEEMEKKKEIELQRGWKKKC